LDSGDRTNIETLKDIVTKFIVFLPIDLPKEAENLIRVLYSMFFLSQEEITAIDAERKAFNAAKGKKKKRGVFGIFGGAKKK
jgi:hypothetical protein